MARSWPRAAFMRRSGRISPAASSPAKEPRALKPRRNRARIEDRGSRIEDRESKAMTHRDPRSSILDPGGWKLQRLLDRKSTRLNSSHLGISYAVFCLKK